MVSTSGRPAAHDGFADEVGGRRSAGRRHPSTSTSTSTSTSDSDLGATAVEYAILASFIAVVIVVGVTLFGTAVAGLFNAAAGI